MLINQTTYNGIQQDRRVIVHYGIPGMRWGKRKVSNSVNLSDDYKKAKNLRKKKMSEMSNSELRDLTTRMQLERQYKDLKSSEISAGKKMLKNVLNEIGKETLKSVIKSGVNITVDYTKKKVKK